MIQKNRKLYFEIMRIIACALVIFNHLPAYALYMSSTGKKQWIYMLCTMFTRINVPLFFMISGALLFEKKESFIQIIKKRVFRFLSVLILFEMGLYMAYTLMAWYKGEIYNVSLSAFFRGALAGKIGGAGAYWYLYAYLGMLLMLPFLQRIAQGLDKQEVRALLLMRFVMLSLIPIINIILKGFGIEGISLSGDFNISLATVKPFFYPLIGYYLENNIDVTKIKRKHIVSMCMAASLGMIVSCICTYYEGNLVGEYSQNFVQLFDYVTTIVVFLLIKHYFSRDIKERVVAASKVVCWMGKLTFGIYLLDPYFKLLFYGKYESLVGSVFPVFICSCGWVLISMVLGSISADIMRRFPVFKQLL